MDPLLEIRDLTVSFRTDEGLLRAVDAVGLRVGRGEVVGLVGESGCGKSVTALSVLRLIPSPPGRIESGEVRFHGENLIGLPLRRMREIRGNAISMIFQEPMTALSPLHRVGKQLVETLELHTDMGRREAWEFSELWLRKVGIADVKQRMYSYPFEMSGGMRQRVMIAMALMLGPELVIADEPTTALDVTVQAQILELMLEVKGSESSLLLITHDMGVIWEMCDRVNVMYASRIVEEGPVSAIFRNPLHPYTQGLLRSIPMLSGPSRRRLDSIEGQVPSLMNLPEGCNFSDRCPHSFGPCFERHPPLFEFSGGRRSACYLSEKWAATG